MSICSRAGLCPLWETSPQHLASVTGLDKSCRSTVSGSETSGRSGIISEAYKDPRVCAYPTQEIFYRCGLGHGVLGVIRASDHALEK